MLKLSARTRRAVDLLGRWYSLQVIAILLDEAERRARARGGRQITLADWEDDEEDVAERLEPDTTANFYRDLLADD